MVLCFFDITLSTQHFRELLTVMLSWYFWDIYNTVIFWQAFEVVFLLENLKEGQYM